MLSPEGVSGVLHMVELADELKSKLVEIGTRIALLKRKRSFPCALRRAI
jgi:hypothetical protein